MMNLNKFAFAGAIALAGAMGFTACSSDDDITSGQNPTFDGETVKTQFSISVPATSAPGSRLSEDIVQGQSPAVFRGLQNMRLIPIDMNTHPNAEGSITLATTDVPNGNVIVLPAIGASDDATDFSGQNATKGNYKVYNDIEIPVNTDAFVFYGEATPTTGNTDLEINQKNGALDPSYVSTGWTTTSPVDQITFSLRQIAPGGSSAVSSDTQALLAVLNGIAGTTGWSSITDAPDGDALLYRLYKTFTLQEVSDGTTYAPTSAAGSSENIRLMAQNLYNTIKEANYTEEGTAKTVADAIITSIETYFTKTGDNVPYTLAWKDSYSAYNTASFPGNYGLPDGSVQLTYSEGKFSYSYSADYATTGMQVTDLANYTFPTSLYYWTNSTIRTADTRVLEGLAGNYANWNGEGGVLSSAYTDGNAGVGSVTASTQSVALYQQIQYAVAQFKVNPWFRGEIEDNGENWEGGGKIVTIPTDGMPLTAILIGGQKNVKYDFTTQTDGSPTEYTVYDASQGDDGTGVLVKQYSTTTTPLDITPAYSLALETKGDAQETIRFALEFKNNTAEEFVGRDGIVPVGGKFYLVGELHANDTNTKVFEQDHTTTANVAIESLKNAYNCIPDLRMPGLELGLSVDLTWQTGLTEDVVIE